MIKFAGSDQPDDDSMGEGLPNTNSPGPRSPASLMIVHDDPSPCPYLPSQTCRLPLRFGNQFDLAETDLLLESGFRRSGAFVYDTQCDGCAKCIATRLEVSQFQLSKSQRRVWKRGEAAIKSRWMHPSADEQRTRLFNLHRNDRDLAIDRTDATVRDYQNFLTDSCMQTVELSFQIDGDLVGISIMDVGATSVSAVYTYFDNAARRYSLGTYAVLKQVDWARNNGRRYVYLGFNVADNPHLNYKSRFRPQQQRINGVWKRGDQ